MYAYCYVCLVIVKRRFGIIIIGQSDGRVTFSSRFVEYKPDGARSDIIRKCKQTAHYFQSTYPIVAAIKIIDFQPCISVEMISFAERTRHAPKFY